MVNIKRNTRKLFLTLSCEMSNVINFSITVPDVEQSTLRTVTNAEEQRKHSENVCPPMEHTFPLISH